ncbi:cysteine-rich repeat secretory protein 12 [Morus notabilis]|uniref:cysteine-rich repeat secretory protein 12 n=1 Tax=Morus notabilis TaxID=981085 RepID=UPI000CECEDE5|nr:cysteine-rich repeat secretory protein 12 [Morus notabilis]XP_024030704.1 cysteine-rich repeat secretory protein 12 [Morus notabilis]
MCRTKTQTSSLSLLFFLVTASLLTALSTAATETFVFGGCSKLKYTPGTPYESLVNSILTSLVNSAMFSTYNNFTIPSSSSSNDVVSGLFQCRGDLGSDACSRCVARAVSQLGTLCLDACGGALQLEGCFVKYDNATFLGVEDKTEVVKKCGPSIGYDSDALTRCNAVLDYLQNPAAGAGNGGTLFRTGGSGNVQGVAQCVGDLSPSECQDCVSDAIQRLKTECGPSSWGDVYLAKCYARFSQGGYHSHGKKDDDNNDEEIEKTLAILIGLIAGVALLIVFLSFLRKLCDSGKGGK